MTTEQSLGARFANTLVGRLMADNSGRMSFCYDELWLSSEQAFPISLSMPLGPQIFQEPAHNWFANLLPEERQRQRVAKRLASSPAR